MQELSLLEFVNYVKGSWDLKWRELYTCMRALRILHASMHGAVSKNISSFTRHC